MASPIIGIDLGTTNSAVAILQDGKVRFLENALGDKLTPSAVALDATLGTLTVGRTAKDLLAQKPHLAAAAFKRSMGDEVTFELGDRKLSPLELSAHVLDTLRFDAERALGCTVNRCVVTVPAYFNEAQRQATKQAAELAGFTVERVLNEPTAAAIAYGLHQSQDEKRFLVFDLGGGTFDVCVMELFEGLLEVKSVAGESRLGGEEFTAALVELCLNRAGTDSASGREDKQPFITLVKRAELLKRQLSRWPSGEIRVPILGSMREEKTLQISRKEANVVFEPLLDKMLAACRSALRGAQLKSKDLDEIVLVGGATRMHCVREFVRAQFSKEPKGDIDPDLVVAHGAAVQAALCAQDSSVEDIVVTDIASHSLGIESVRTVGNQKIPGYFEPVIHRNTTIPVSCEESFATIERNQRCMNLRIYEGEARRAKDNRLIGELAVEGIPRGPAGQSVLVRFTYDLDGMLEVEATVAETGQHVSRVLHRKGKKPDEATIERFRKRVQVLKADPGERPRYKDLRVRAQGLWSDASAEDRETIGRYLDLFEAALSERKTEEIDRAYADLLSLCESIDKGERW